MQSGTINGQNGRALRAARPPIDPNGRRPRMPYTYPFFDPVHVFRALADFLAPVQFLTWLIWPAAIVAATGAAFNWEALMAHIERVFDQFTFWQSMFLGMVTSNLFSKVFLGIVMGYYGADTREFGLKLKFGILLKFYVDRSPIKGLDLRSRKSCYATSLLTKLALFAIGIFMWNMLRRSGSGLADVCLAFGVVGFGSFLFTANPLFPADGCKWMSAALGRPNLRQNSFRLTYLLITRRPIPEGLDRREAAALLFYAICAIIFTAILVYVVFSAIALALEAQFQGNGVVIFCLILAMLTHFFVSVRSRRRGNRASVSQDRNGAPAPVSRPPSAVRKRARGGSAPQSAAVPEQLALSEGTDRMPRRFSIVHAEGGPRQRRTEDAEDAEYLNIFAPDAETTEPASPSPKTKDTAPQGGGAGPGQDPEDDDNDGTSDLDALLSDPAPEAGGASLDDILAPDAKPAAAPELSLEDLLWGDDGDEEDDVEGLGLGGFEDELGLEDFDTDEDPAPPARPETRAKSDPQPLAGTADAVTSTEYKGEDVSPDSFTSDFAGMEHELFEDADAAPVEGISLFAGPKAAPAPEPADPDLPPKPRAALDPAEITAPAKPAAAADVPQDPPREPDTEKTEPEAPTALLPAPAKRQGNKARRRGGAEKRGEAEQRRQTPQVPVPYKERSPAKRERQAKPPRPADDLDRVLKINAHAEPARNKWIRRGIWLALIGAFLYVVNLPYAFEVGGEFIVQPLDRAEVRARTDGEIIQINIKEGDWVESGEVMAILSNWDEQRDIAVREADLARLMAELDTLIEGPSAEEIAVARQKIATAQVQVEIKTADLDLQQRLFDSGTTTKTALDNAASDLRLAEAALEEARTNLDLVEAEASPSEIAAAQAEIARHEEDLAFARLQLEHTNIRAVTSGQVVSSLAVVPIGVYLPEGGLFAELEDNRTIIAEIEVPETSIEEVAIGAPVELRLWSDTKTSVFGTVERLAPKAEEREFGRVMRVLVRVENPEGKLAANMTGHGKIAAEERPVWQAFTRIIVRFFEVELWSWLP